MKKRNVLMALTAAAMVLQLVGTAGTAGSQTEPDVEFTFSPTSGPPGTSITFSGSGCTHDPASTFDGWFYLAQGNTNQEFQEFSSDAEGDFGGEYDTSGIPPGEYTTFVLCATTEKIGFGESFTVTVPVIPGSTYFPLTPARVLDTRDGTGTGGTTNPIGADSSINVKVTGVGGVPASGVTAVALNVVATNASGPLSWLTVWPTGQPMPWTSNLNFDAGVSVPNLVVARVGADGRVSMWNHTGTVHVAADVQGWFTDDTTGSTYVPRDPVRILDTRDGTGGRSTRLGPGETMELKVTEVGTVPAGSTAVVLNVTATNVSGPESYLTVWPSGSTQPDASNLNYTGGQTVPNLVIARVGDGGNVSIYNRVGTVDVIADTQGYFAAPASPGAALPGSVYWPSTPVRILDTRDGTGVPGGYRGHLGIDSTVDVQVTGEGGVPEDATAVVLNVTVTEVPAGPWSWLTVYPTGTARPDTSNLNFVPGQTVPNLVVARIGADGKISIYNSLNFTVVIADVQGWFTP
ncbi:MAG TPA: hypothetical protein VHF27_08180 [Acidimicrobiales bacterium]|nr:hypothetical protein [Acidimicrobiales bacterium]